MHFALAMVAPTHAQHSAPPPDGGGALWFFLAAGAFTLFSLSIPLVVSYWIDVRLHEGVNFFKRRRVLRSGTPAEATVLSSTVLMKTTGSKYKSAYSTIYEIHPPGGASFRAKGIEVMYFSEADANRLSTGATVQVKFDPSNHIVVLVRVDKQKFARDREAARKAKEEALLRDGSR